MKDILNSHTVKTLKSEISKTNIKGYSKLKKPELVALMLKHQERFVHIKAFVKTTKAVSKQATKTVKPDVKPRQRLTVEKQENKTTKTVEEQKDTYKNLLKQFVDKFNPQMRKKLKKTDIENYLKTGSMLLANISELKDKGFLSNQMEQMMFIKENGDLSRDFVKSLESFKRLERVQRK